MRTQLRLLERERVVVRLLECWPQLPQLVRDFPHAFAVGLLQNAFGYLELGRLDYPRDERGLRRHLSVRDRTNTAKSGCAPALARRLR